ncbi:MAG: TPM domain-containing protein, partial [Thermoanaerobaculia bacterium]|nr:TPM domain-containing protein [Thermoanaerobaculia bacterium]
MRPALLGFLWVASVASFALDVPFLSGRVMDEADLLSPNVEVELENRLEGLEQATGAQVVVLTLPSLEGEVIEDYALRVAETWRLGQEQRDNGLLLLIAPQERRLRIEVGYGLEGVVPDILAARVMDELIQPRFRTGDFDGGTRAGVEALAKLIEGDPAALPPEPRRRFGPGMVLFPILLIVAILIFLLFLN